MKRKYILRAIPNILLPSIIVLSCSSSVNEKKKASNLPYKYLKVIENIGAGSGTKNIEKMREKIIGIGKKLNLKEEIQSFNYKIDNKNTVVGKNIIYKIEGIKEKNKIISFGAHYDTTRDFEKNQNYGINDNKVGVATLLGLIDYFSKNKPEKTMIFIFFDGEEEGNFGSKHYTNLLKKDQEKYNKFEVYLNFDGVVGGDSLFIAHGLPDIRPLDQRNSGEAIGNDDKIFFDKILSISKEYKIEINKVRSHLLNDIPTNISEFSNLDYKEGQTPLEIGDHNEFNAIEIPVVWFFSSYKFDSVFDKRAKQLLFHPFTQVLHESYWFPLSKEEINAYNDPDSWPQLTKEQRDIGIFGGPKNEQGINPKGYPRRYEKNWGRIRHQSVDTLENFEKNFPNRLENQFNDIMKIITNLKY